MKRPKNCQLILPTDVVLADKFDNDSNTAIAKVTDIQGRVDGVDVGPGDDATFRRGNTIANTIV
jgi:phosphoglycerate kinase